MGVFGAVWVRVYEWAFGSPGHSYVVAAAHRKHSQGVACGLVYGRVPEHGGDGTEIYVGTAGGESDREGVVYARVGVYHEGDAL